MLQKTKDKLQNFKTSLSAIDMTTGKPWKKLMLFTVPLLVGNMFQQMYSTTDAIILGTFVGDYALGAVGSSIPIFFLIMVLLIGIAVGAGIMVSQYFGAKKREELSQTIGAALLLTTIMGVIMMISSSFVTRPLLVLMDTPEEVLEDAVLYMQILMWGVLGMAYFNILSGILRGLGDAFSPLIYLALTSILNIIFNLILIGWFGLGVWGAAIGTVFAQGLTSILCLRRLLKMRDVFELSFKYLKPNKTYLVQVLKLGVPTGAAQAVFAIAMMIVQPLVNSFGPMFLAVNIIVMRIDGFVMMPNFSFGNAMTVYTGQNVGAGRMDRIAQGMKECSYLAIGTSIGIVAILLTFGHNIAGMFTQTQEVIYLAMEMISILAVGYVVFSLNMVLSGVIRGAGDAMTPLILSIISTVLIRVPTAYLFVHWLGTPHALFYSLLSGWVFITIITGVAYKIGHWRKKGIVKNNN